MTFPIVNKRQQTTVDIIRLIVLAQLKNSLPDYNFGLPDMTWDQRVVIYNQEYTLAPIDGLWIEVAFLASKVFSIQNDTQENNGIFEEIQNLYQQESVMVRLFSKNIEALQYKELIMMGFGSIYAQQQQEEYGFKICAVTPYPDTSELEGGAINYRHDLNIMCLVAYQNIITAVPMQSFETAVTASNGSATLYRTFSPTVLPS